MKDIKVVKAKLAKIENDLIVMDAYIKEMMDQGQIVNALSMRPSRENLVSSIMILKWVIK